MSVTVTVYRETRVKRVFNMMQPIAYLVFTVSCMVLGIFIRVTWLTAMGGGGTGGGEGNPPGVLRRSQVRKMGRFLRTSPSYYNDLRQTAQRNCSAFLPL
jgi:hypothetical protein